MGVAVPADDMPDNIVPADDMPEDTTPKSKSARLVDETPENPLSAAIHQAASGAGHTILGGYKGLGNLLAGHGLDAASQAVTDEQTSLSTPR